jgi:hypothetical protein
MHMTKEMLINLPEVVAAKRFSSFTRLLAANLMKNPYLTLGSFFKSLSAEDLDHLLDLAEHEGEGDKAEEIVLITLLLAQAEGTLVSNESRILEYCSMFKMMIAGCSLHRQGMLKCNFDNMSFGEDASELTVFEPIKE